VGPGRPRCTVHGRGMQVQHRTHTVSDRATVHMIAYHILLLIQGLHVQKRNVFWCRKKPFDLFDFKKFFFKKITTSCLKSVCWCNQLKLSNRAGMGFVWRVKSGMREGHAAHARLIDGWPNTSKKLLQILYLKNDLVNKMPKFAETFTDFRRRVQAWLLRPHLIIFSSNYHS
jgi:hypothetical protein